MSQLFRLSGAVQRDPEVDAWFAGVVRIGPEIDARLPEPADELRRLARVWFDHMRGCGPDVVELLHDGCPVACVADAPFGYVNAFKAHVNVGFFRGAMLDDPQGLLEGAGKRMRHVELGAGRPVNPDALRDLVSAAYEDIQMRLRSEP
ncbi:DUF1801 domain-containing protein [Phenylobacterium sp. LH3H17]|uniref:DUF1801 domain-containing protein n=1 Tax=Phenylobacterium sp. LH3H17 TaxID=2903901 RepID=UPI0020C98A82|nr:DUF1801 domain-containing protein [Phenylobacterium sp. LH3H17]UTP41508.1 DUF1801 domain-containing protein [Phenylobacterium sp. LH3H17]